MRVLRHIFILALALAAPAAAQAPSRIALVIANAHYAGYPELPNTVVDSGLVSRALRDVGFAVETKTDLDRAGIRDALARFSNRAKVAQVALIYFAGHGMAEGGRNWLLPVDVRLERTADLADNAIASTMLVSATTGARARVIVLDACRNNPFASDATPGLGVPSGGAEGTLYLYSADVGQEAQDGPPGRGSPFARAFATSIVRPGLALQLVAGEISTAVFNETGGLQLPFNSSSVSGEALVMAPAPPQPSVAAITVLGAQVRVSELGAEVEAFDAAAKANRPEVWRDFLQRFPNGRLKGVAELSLGGFNHVAAPGANPLEDARAALDVVTPQEWSAAEISPLVTRLLASAGRDQLFRLADAGDARAQWVAAYCLASETFGCDVDLARALAYARMSAARRFARGQVLLATMYANGKEGVLEQDNAQALRLYRLAVAQGSAVGQVELGVLYYFGNTGVVAQDMREAARLFRLAAAQGSAIAQSNLGVMYAQAYGGVPFNPREAVRLYRLAAAQGDAGAQSNLAALYDQGEAGLKQDRVEAVRLYRLAVAQGLSQAQLNLGDMYEKGEGVSADRAEAIRLYRLAARQENSQAQANLRRLGETW